MRTSLGRRCSSASIATASSEKNRAWTSKRNGTEASPSSRTRSIGSRRRVMPILTTPSPNAPTLRDDVDVAGADVRGAVVDVLDRPLDLGQLARGVGPRPRGRPWPPARPARCGSAGAPSPAVPARAPFLLRPCAPRAAARVPRARAPSLLHLLEVVGGQLELADAQRVVPVGDPDVHHLAQPGDRAGDLRRAASIAEAERVRLEGADQIVGLGVVGAQHRASRSRGPSSGPCAADPFTVQLRRGQTAPPSAWPSS